MASSGAPRPVCLGVAIDHRIRRLFGPVPRPASDTRRGTHVSILQTHGRRLDRRDDEIRVTGEMAGPASTGGIAVALQQPRDDHPFEKGTEAVIEDCETLTALGELFDAVSCSTLDIREDVSVIDLLPYTTEAEMGLMGEAAMGSTFRTSVQTFCGKQPDVVLCAGRIWLPRHHDHCKGEAWKLESGGVGRTFDKYPVVILRGENREIVRIRRVNGFHLSYAMNYHLEYSYLRQLLLLVVAQTCSVYKGDWEEETWMGSLRTYCSKFSRELTNVTRNKYLPYYAQLYSEILSAIRETITSMVRSAGDATLATLEPAGTYGGLLESGLSEQYNDASLILCKMSKLKGMGWPERFDKVNGCALRRAAAETLRFAEQRWDRRGWFGSARLRATVLGGIASVSLCITTTRGQFPELDLGRASATFLDTAEALEVMLWDLLRRESGEQDVTASDWDAAQVAPLADILGGLALSEPSPPRDTAGKADPITFDTSINQ